MPKRLPARIAIIMLAALLAIAPLHAAVSATSTTDDNRVDQQIRFLTTAISGSAPRDMQHLFPEGAFFTFVLTGMAAGNLALRSDGERRAELTGTVRTALEQISQSWVSDPFGTIPELAHGTFYQGWKLQLEVLAAQLEVIDRPTLRTHADTLNGALTRSPTGVPPSYPGGYWPCDAVVAMSAVVRAQQLLSGTAPAGLDDWVRRVERLQDPQTGLLAHKVSEGGRVLDGAQGSSQAIIQAFWADVSPATAGASWDKFATTFLTSAAGLVGVREYPHGTTGAGDVDSGPLVLDVSASASAVTLAAARRVGALNLATTLDQEAEYLGLGLGWAGSRRYWLGTIPVGDAFLAWARSVPVSTVNPPATTATAGHWLWAHAAVLTLPLLVLAGVLTMRTTRAARSTTTVAAG